jgi:MSHA biogenesis protein MshQ
VELSQENLDPGGVSGLSFSVIGNNIAKHSSFTKTTLDFGANSIAIIPTPIYHDAGKIRLHANYKVGAVTQLIGSSNEFWVSPAELVVSARTNALSLVGSIILNGATATASPVHKAGEDFELRVSALNSLGVITPNYSPGQIELKLTRTGPLLPESVDGDLRISNTLTNGTLTTSVTPASFQSVTLTSFSSGVSSFNAAQYSEVGLLNLEVQDSDYSTAPAGGTRIIIPSTPINIGRFTPHHFTQTVAQDGLFLATCNTASPTFAYSGQKDESIPSVGAISYLSNPIFEITAFNKQGNRTQNYYQNNQGSANDFMKLSASDVSINVPTLDQAAVGVDGSRLSLTANMNTGTLSQNDLTALPSVVELPKGVLHYQLSDNDNFFYNRTANALVDSFTADIDFSTAIITDGDSVMVTTPTVYASPAGVEIRFGRLSLENSFGPETSDFPQPKQLEHYDGGVFVASSNASCVDYNMSRMSLSNISLAPSFTDIFTNPAGGSGYFNAGKTREIQLRATGDGNQGQIGVSYDDYDWLEYDWDDDGVYDNDPNAVATFGLFRGNDRIIHWREVFNE